MEAIVQFQGKQFRVAEGSLITTDRVALPVGEILTIDSVLLAISSSADGSASAAVGTPYVSGASVEAVVVRHFRDKKIRIFKKKIRKRYQKTIGHRQERTELRIRSVVA